MKTYPEEIHQVNPAKNYKKFNQAKIQQLHQEKWKFSKIKIGSIKVGTPETQPHVILEVKKDTKD